MNRPDVFSSQNNSLKTEALALGPTIAPNSRLANRFRIVEQLGSGAQANVYSAIDELLDVKVALKVIEGGASDPVKMQTIRNEVNIARQLQHPNIIRVHDIFSDGDTAFFTMAFIEGEPLYTRLEKPISKTDFDKWQQQLIVSLLACKSIGIKHGDIKPDNILIDDNEDIKLIDFGIGQSATACVQTSGHQRYTAPEVIQTGKASEHSDTYSLGKVLEDMLGCVEKEGVGISHYLWLKKRKTCITQLTHHLPAKRLSLEEAFSFDGRALSVNGSTNVTNKTLVVFSIIALLVLVLSASIFSFTWYQKSPPKLAADSPIQLLVLNDPQYPLLETINTLLRYPLSTHPNIVLDNKEQTQALVSNLALSPFTSENDRTDLAATLAANSALLLDATPTSNSAYLLHASVLSMPANTPIFTVSHNVNANSLSKDLEEFSNKLIQQLFDAVESQSPQPQPDLRYLDVLDSTWQKGETLNSADAIEAIIATTPDYPGGWVADARNRMNIGDYDRARQALETLTSIPNLAPYWRLQSELLRAELNEDLALAQQSINALVSQFPNRPELLSMRADIYQWAGEDTKAMADYKAAIALRPNNGQLWFELARLQIINGDIDTATSDSLTRALVAFRQAKDTRGESLVLNAFGIAYLRTADNIAAARYFKDALALRDAKTQPSQRAKTLANYAIATSLTGDYATAEASLEEAVKLLHDLGDLAQEAHVNDTLGFMFEERGQFARALDYYKRGLDIRVQTDDKVLQPQSMSNVAYMHFLIGDISLAEIYWQQAKMLFERNGDESHLLRTHQNLAQLSLVKGDKNIASNYLTTVEERLSTQHNQEKLYNHLLFSYLNFANGNLEKATQHAAQAKRLAQESEDSRAKTEVLLWEGEICLLTANWSCLEKRLESVLPTISEERHEQFAVYQWLTLGLKHYQGNLNGESDGIYKTLLNNDNVPAITETKILLDMQQRLSLGASSSIMEKLSSLIKPTYYQQYLQWLYIKASFGDVASVEKLKQKLALYPSYWRNHLYYRAVPGKEGTADKLTTRWLSQLSEKQAGDYRNAYFE
ncbi:serine/threonine protein kinase [Alteromonas sp. BL110]|uniref:serine/threonine-protein kinase n=1 Tax=Alteromonas sp. BL110 TaxID=1714845 RepID=UPI000E4B6C1E|nr:serine/threonine-protein kinase [Alteromonas sp. BL110]AXT39048.1 serine/threonine protein kinase [Alteromonas sp. BL110]RKM85296.1 serine/threonine-protein kinase [Alteromonas sp. BL110]